MFNLNDELIWLFSLLSQASSPSLSKLLPVHTSPFPCLDGPRR